MSKSTNRTPWQRGALARAPREDEVHILGELLRKHGSEYRADRRAAALVARAGQAPPAKDVDVVELAAWMSVARIFSGLISDSRAAARRDCNSCVENSFIRKPTVPRCMP